MRKRLLAIAVPAAATVALAVGGTAAADHPGEGGTPFSANLLGANECYQPGVCGQGDPDGSGTALLRLNQGQGEVCYEFTVSDVQTITAAHIHAAPAGQPGPVIVPLNPAPGDAADGHWSGCTTADKDLIKQIRQNPENYYVNVHNPSFGPGALRDQLQGPGGS